MEMKSLLYTISERLTQRLPKQSSQTRRAAILSVVTILFLALVTITTHSIRLATNHVDNSYRILEEGNDYSQYTCDTIFQITEADSEQRCNFAKTCNSGAGLFCSFVFCNTWNLSLTTWCSILSPFLIIWLVLLFRMLGSTAEDFFSPSLEMFSMKMGLPPRFAGVTLLALGNGAADVSATISAITQNPEDGYQMSLGALTGAGMFVSTVIAGIVIMTADGVKCRGALVRDVIMYMFTIGLVYYFFSQGEIGPRAISSFFWSYFSYVLVVLSADIYHRAVVLPRMQRQAEEQNEQAAVSAIMEYHEDDFSNHPQQVDPSSPEVELSDAPTARYGPPTNAFQSPLHAATEDTENHDVLLSPSLTRKTRDKNIFAANLDRFMIAMSNYGPNEGTDGGNVSGWSGGLEVSSNQKDHYLKLHGTKGILNKRGSKDDQDDTNLGSNDPISTYTALMEGVDNMCTVEGSLISAMGTSWSQSCNHAKDEFKMHFADYVDDIKENEENNMFDRFFLFCELPFTVMRKVRVVFLILCTDFVSFL
jgi:sodium/potassium/calcium exchanger 6